MATQRSILLGLTALSLGCFFGSLFAPAFAVCRGPSDLTWHGGFELLWTGWLGFFITPKTTIAWFSNVSYMLVIVLLVRGNRISIGWPAGQVLLLAAGILAILPAFGGRIPIDEAGNTAPIRLFGAGFWLWISAQILANAACVANNLWTSRKNDLTD